MPDFDLLAGLSKEATQLRRYGGLKTPAVATVVAMGDTTILTPTMGNRIRLFWVSAINDPVAVSAPLIKILLGTTEVYRAYAVAHWEVFEGVVNAPLIVNLSAAGSVAFTAHLQEFT